MYRKIPRTGRDLEPESFRGILGRDDPVIVEVGANDGRDTARFLEAFPAATITVFEPDERPLRRFWRNVPPGRLELVAAAAADFDGSAKWFASSGKPPVKGDWAPEDNEDWSLSGSICRPTGHLELSPWVTFRENGQVPVIRLDTWLRQKPSDYRIDLIWADVQGAEAMMIRGATETLKRTHWLYTEFSDQPMYEGQPDCNIIMAMLPRWRLNSIHAQNLLMENMTWQTP